MFTNTLLAWFGSSNIIISIFQCLERDGIASHLKHLVERLLLQNIEDKQGTSGSLDYHLGW